MQLKRDTDYALRIIECIFQHDEPGITKQKISVNTGIPQVIVSRLCTTLEDKNIIGCKEKGIYSFSEDSLERTLLDVISAIEMQDDIFAVFDRSSSFFRKNEKILTGMNQAVINSLNSISIRELVCQTS